MECGSVQLLISLFASEIDASSLSHFHCLIFQGIRSSVLWFAFCLSHLRFYFESLWHVVPKQPPSHVQKHMHHPHVRHLPARWCPMLLMSEWADVICQVLTAGTWCSCKHRHGVSRKGVLAGALHTHTHTPAAVLCVP